MNQQESLVHRPWVRRELIVFIALLVLSVLVRLPDLAMPLERDEGEYAYAAQEILRGHMPYADTFCQKPPVVFFWYLAGFVLLGQSVIAIHLTMTVAAALAALGIYLLARRLLGPEGRTGAWLAALVFAFSAAGSGYFGSAANTEIFMLAPMVFGVYFAHRALETEKSFFWFLAGLLCGLAFLTKQVALFSFAGPAVYASWIMWRQKRPIASHVKPLVFGLGGIGAAIAPFAVWLSARGVLGAAWDAAFGHNIAYVGSPFGWWKWTQLAGVISDRFLLSDGLLWACLAGCLLMVVLGQTRRHRALWFALLWFGGSILGVALGPYTFGHYFLQVLPPLALAGGAFCSLFSSGSATPTPALCRRARLLTLIAGAALIAPMVVCRLSTLTDPIEKRSYDLYSVYGPSPFAAAVEVGDALAATTDPDDLVLIRGSEPEILFYARRRSATRYTIFYPLTGNFESTDAMVEELFAEIDRNRPAKVVLVNVPTSFIVGGPKLGEIIDRLQQVLDGHYVSETTFFATPDGRTIRCGPSDQPPVPSARPLFRIFSRRK